MTDLDTMGWKAVSETGAVAAGGARAVRAGVDILERDGNAADAAVATILALQITDHGQCCIGGEVPVLIYDAHNREVKSLSGMGRAPLAQDAIDWYMANGIPADPDIKMAPVPSVVDLCTTLLQRNGTMSFEAVVGATLVLLDEGDAPWHPNLANTLRRMVESEQRASGTREAKIQAASDRFYGRDGAIGDVADEIEAYWLEQGGFLRRADLAAHETLIEEPVSADYRGYRVYKCGPWTQGPYLCQALRLLDGFDVRAMGQFSADHFHVMAEALKLAMADRDTYYGDPNFVAVPMEALLADAYSAVRRPLIDMEHASLEARPGDPLALRALLGGEAAFRPGIGGTTTCVVADRWGNVVSATPSANVARGHGAGAAGVTYGNRLRSLNTTPGHPNCIEAGKRPRITLTPTLVMRKGKPVLAISVAGGDRQDQAALSLLVDHIDFGMPVDEAVTAPRFATSHHQDSFDPNPNRQATFGAAGSMNVSGSVKKPVQDELARRGHRVAALADPIGTPVMLHVDDASGVISVAGDPAAQRHAAGLGDSKA
jgi:gamma-glutamyltranspeptidase/glutathione hydrolase